MKKFLQILLITLTACHLKAQQPPNCVFKKPSVTIHFGTGNVRELNSEALYIYDRVSSSCPTDGHYTYTSYTSDCFSGDWLTLTEDHTPGDANGNMMLVNASYRTGAFLRTNLPALKGNTIYEFGVWMMNVCKPTEKCPFPLLPNITIRLMSAEGKTIAQISTGDLDRRQVPHWTQYRAVFTTPTNGTDLNLVMINNAPGGCGNDFALDDITFSECEIVKPEVTKARPAPVAKPKTTPSTTAAKTPPASKTKAPVVTRQPAKSPPVTKKETTPPVVNKQTTAPKPTVKKEEPAKRPLETSKIGKVQTDTTSRRVSVSKQRLPAPPSVLITRSNPVIKRIETEQGSIKLDLYDNGQIDGDTVSIYHNNRLIVSHQRISQKPITFHILVDDDNPHHELVMVAENLGSIPPNTSLMVLTAGSRREEVFISSSEQKNAKIVIELKK